MKVNYNIQKEERKAMVGIVGKVLETKPTYCGAPSFSYKVGAFEITKDGILRNEMMVVCSVVTS